MAICSWNSTPDAMVRVGVRVRVRVGVRVGVAVGVTVRVRAPTPTLTLNLRLSLSLSLAPTLAQICSWKRSPSGGSAGCRLQAAGCVSSAAAATRCSEIEVELASRSCRG